MLMRALRFLNLAILSVLVGSAAFVYAQDEKQQEDKPARQEEAKPQPKKDEAKPPHQEEAKPSKPDKQLEKQDQKRGQEQSREEAKPEKDKQEHPQMQGDRNRQGQEHPEARGDHARPAGNGGHIPDDKFRAQFGREHHFNARSVIVRGQPRFQYGGYSFELIDAWPAEWVDTDDCYIEYIDGNYYLIDLLHPDIRLAVFVVM
jgi:hypothetical protein